MKYNKKSQKISFFMNEDLNEETSDLLKQSGDLRRSIFEMLTDRWLQNAQLWDLGNDKRSKDA